MASSAEGQDSSPPPNEAPSIMYGPSSPVPLTMTFGELLDYHAETRPDQPAVISHPQNATFSFAQLRKNSRELAQSMAKMGVKKGDLVAISLGSRIEYFEVRRLRFVLFCGTGRKTFNMNGTLGILRLCIPGCGTCTIELCLC